jgi:hypothetical protein
MEGKDLEGLKNFELRIANFEFKIRKIQLLTRLESAVGENSLAKT